MEVIKPTEVGSLPWMARSLLPLNVPGVQKSKASVQPPVSLHKVEGETPKAALGLLSEGHVLRMGGGLGTGSWLGHSHGSGQASTEASLRFPAWTAE